MANIKNSLGKRVFPFLAATVAAVSFSTCDLNGGTGTQPGEDPGGNSTEKINLKGQRVVHTLWSEPQRDPRHAMGYQLRDGTPWFDNYVVLYGFRLIDRNCGAIGELKCNESGLHLHMINETWDYMLPNWNTLVKPLRDKGIKFVMSIVPGIGDGYGGGGGVTVGTLYRWPMEEWYSWKSLEGEDVYPYGPDAVKKVIGQIKDFRAKYPFDGIGYDEEYGSTGTGLGRGAVYPDAQKYPLSDVGKAWNIGGENILRFANEVNLALGLKFGHEVYEIRYGQHVAESYTYPEGEMPAGSERTVLLEDVIDYSYEAFYGGWQSKSGFGMPRDRFGPASVELGTIGSTPKPAYGKNGIEARMRDHLGGNYGVVMYYNMTGREQFENTHPGIPPFDQYFSDIGRILYGQGVVYIGDDYNVPIFPGGNPG